MEEPHRTELIETIRDVTAKKIYLEVEYARCVLLIVKGKEGRIQRCQYNPLALDVVQKVVQKYREFWDQQLNFLDDYIEKAKNKNKK